MLKLLYTIIISIFVLAISGRCDAQITISGPSCVVASTEYQYVISANWPAGSKIQICVQGGIIASTGKSCMNTPPLSYVRVIWNDSASGTIQITATDRSASYRVGICSVLQPGEIESSRHVQAMRKESPSVIVCSAARGGNCKASYQYQWQQSADNKSWTDISGAVSKDLNLLSLRQTFYYRRRVREISSKSEGFSDVAMIVALPEVAGK
jgi:hypothetical protein